MTRRHDVYKSCKMMVIKWWLIFLGHLKLELASPYTRFIFDTSWWGFCLGLIFGNGPSYVASANSGSWLLLPWSATSTSYFPVHPRSLLIIMKIKSLHTCMHTGPPLATWLQRSEFQNPGPHNFHVDLYFSLSVPNLKFPAPMAERSEA